MKKTCLNCAYCKKVNGSYVCEAMNTSFNNPRFTAFNKFLMEHRYDIPATSDTAVYNDILTGETYCYRYLVGDENNDKLLKQNFELNKKLALDTIDHILKTNIIYSNEIFMYINLSKEARQHLIQTRDQFLQLNF